MHPKFKTQNLKKSGSLNFSKAWLAENLDIHSPDDSVIQFAIPGQKAVILLKLDPLNPLPQAILDIVTPPEARNSATIEAPVVEGAIQEHIPAIGQGGNEDA